VYVYDYATRNEEWQSPSTGGILTGLEIADVDGDGALEMLAMRSAGDLYVFDGPTGQLEATWTQSPGSIISNTGEPAHAGSWKARLLGQGRNVTHWLDQGPAFGATGQSRTLKFWMRIVTADQSNKRRDHLYVRITNASGSTLTTLATFANADWSAYGS
jgi:hypothetical protein